MSLITLGLSGTPSAAFGGSANFIATGHDMDLHCAGGETDSCDYLKIVVNTVRDGSTLPVLALDHGTQVGESLTLEGIPFVSVDPDDATALNAMQLVGPTGAALYSAIVVASDETCGGCDNTATSSTNIAARSVDIAAFFNAGGGILALAGADNANYYDFVPLPNVNSVAVEEPFTVTPAGATLGITTDQANCCPTHNSFEPPPSPFVILEKDTADKAETIAALKVAITGGGFVTTTTTTTPTTSSSTSTTSTPTTSSSTSTTSTPTTSTSSTPGSTSSSTTAAPAVAGAGAQPGPAVQSGTLPRTGFPTHEVALGAGVLVLLGAACLMLRRRLV